MLLPFLFNDLLFLKNSLSDVFVGIVVSYFGAGLTGVIAASLKLDGLPIYYYVELGRLPCAISSAILLSSLWLLGNSSCVASMVLVRRMLVVLALKSTEGQDINGAPQYVAYKLLICVELYIAEVLGSLFPVVVTVVCRLHTGSHGPIDL